MAAQKTASTEAPTATTIRSRRNSAPGDEFGGAAFGAVVVSIRSFLSGCGGIGHETELDGIGHATQRPCEARGQQRAAEDAGGVARHQLQTAARSSHTRVSGPLPIVTNTVAVAKPLPRGAAV